MAEQRLLRFLVPDRVWWTQCQAQLLDQFSVWVPPVTRLKRLTLGPRARAGHSRPGRGGCAPPAPKKRLVSPTALTDNIDRPGDDSRAPGAATRCYRS